MKEKLIQFMLTLSRYIPFLQLSNEKRSVKQNIFETKEEDALEEKEHGCSELEYAEIQAQRGDADSQFRLGIIFYAGEEVSQDCKKAARYFSMAARQGNVNAQFALGVMYQNGDGVQQDYVKAKDFFIQVAKQGNASAQCSLGLLYKNGNGVKQDYFEALKYFQLAAAQNEAKA
ncbi:tetratricopeptide repeat protein [Snodgrassella communis]|uniref:tetratricopeptide repeat protein n=1 Tax=Snodgrassella communis TaxID=2946699 RepID=UPI001EF51BCC|nr:tetratricopeptide repeat protein [Snodgrassella communis]